MSKVTIRDVLAEALAKSNGDQAVDLRPNPTLVGVPDEIAQPPRHKPVLKKAEVTGAEIAAAVQAALRAGR
jgi:hypothetical protein